MSESHDEILGRMAERAPQGVNVTLPPRIAEELGPRFTELVDGERLTAAYPAQPRHANPMGVLQGGILGAAIDHCMGSLAFYSTHHPCASVTFNLTFIKPLPADGREYTVTAFLRARTRSLAFLEGEARDAENNLLATATSTVRILA